jgi:putative spermidine/putrescine transport system substrate-binding protein
LTRRGFLKTAASISGTAALGISAPWMPSARAASQIVWAGWGGDYQKHQSESFAVPFTKETGTQVAQVTSPGNMVSIIKSQVDNNNPEWDVVELTEPEVYTSVKGGYLADLTYDPKIDGDFPHGLLAEYDAPFVYAAFVLAWNKDAFPKRQPKSWADFWNVKEFPGRRTACGWFAYYMLEIALMADGVPAGKIYPLDDQKIERAFAKLEEIRPHIDVWWSAGAQSAQLFADGEVAMGMIYENRIREAYKAGKPVAWTLNQALVEKSTYVIPKDSRNKDAAMKFINVSLRRENQAAFVRAGQYGATNPKAYTLLSEKESALNIGAPKNLAHEHILDGKFWADAYPKYSDRWEVLKTKK